ncbi:hypothetical protein OVA29_05925 [Exiguobacterium sp. SL14]|nr:hypothetical protein [Exiguobacterium sp. SL14]MCY1690353.1 hypothetical protein [Exiguobacterium sp. SL14]
MLFAGLENILKQEGGTVRRVDAERGELAFTLKEVDGLATVIMVAGGRTAVDLFLHRKASSDLILRNTSSESMRHLTQAID